MAEKKKGDFAKEGKTGQVIQAEFNLHGGENIYTVVGDITDIDADVLVNAADPKLEHNGGLAKAIVNKGGGAISKECREHVRKKGPLSEGEIYVTSAGNLQAKIVIHAVSPVWKGGHNNEDEALREIIWKCLETTAKKGYKSVAVPALGAGIYGGPVKWTTRVIVETIRDFFQKEHKSSLCTVYFSDIIPQTVKCFTQALENNFGKQLISDVKQRPIPQPRHTKASEVTGETADGESLHDGISLLTLNTSVEKFTQKPIARSVTQPVLGSKATHTRRNSERQDFQNELDLVNILNEKFWLPDDHIDMAMKLIKRDYPGIHGLVDASVMAVGMVKKHNGQFLQIFNSGGNHWITITNIKCTTPATVKVYDSKFRMVRKSTLFSIFNMLVFNPLHPVTIEMPKFQMQKNGSDCGPFAVAAAVSVVLSKEPSVEIYDEDNLRPHLFHCLQTNSIKAFPTILARVKYLEYTKFVLFQCCQCDFPIFEAETRGVCEYCRLPCHAKKNCSIAGSGLCKKCVKNSHSLQKLH